MSKEDHIHKFARLGKSRTGKVRYRCVLPNCFFVVNKEMLLGKQSLCNECDTPIILDRYDLTRAAPRCINCKKTKEAVKFKQAANVASKLFGILGNDEEAKHD